MNETWNLFTERLDEIEFYYTELVRMDVKKNSSDREKRLFKIMKSTFILMLYNLIEASIMTGIQEVYDNIREENVSYDRTTKYLQKLWLKSQLKSFQSNAKTKTYVDRVGDIVENILIQKNITFYKADLGNMFGNLDAKAIKQLCDSHGIRCKLKNKGEVLCTIKTSRNHLAHGDLSFSECGRDFSIQDLNKIMKETIQFIKDVLVGMENYIKDKKYLAAS